MLMSPGKLLLFRLFLILFGWIPGFSTLLKAAMVRVFVRKRGKPYVAQSRFFDPLLVRNAGSRGPAPALPASREDDFVYPRPSQKRRLRLLWIALPVLIFLAVHGKYVRGGFLYYDEACYLDINTLASCFLSQAVSGEASPSMWRNFERNVEKPWRLPRSGIATRDRADAWRRYLIQIADLHGKPLFMAPIPPLAVFAGVSITEQVQITLNMLYGVLACVAFLHLYRRRCGDFAGIAAYALLLFSLLHSLYLSTGFPSTMQFSLFALGMLLYLDSFDRREGRRTPLAAAGAGACFALSQLAYPTTLFALLPIALVEGIAFLCSNWRNWRLLAFAGLMVALGAVPNALPLLWYEAGLEQDYVAVTGLSAGQRFALAAGLSAFSLAAMGVLIAFLRRVGSPTRAKALFLFFGAAAIFLLANVLFAFRDCPYFVALLVHANPARQFQKSALESLFFLAHAEGPVFFWTSAILAVASFPVFLARLSARGRVNRFDVLSVLAFPIAVLSTLFYGYHFERRNYFVLYLYYFMAALYPVVCLLRARAPFLKVEEAIGERARVSGGERSSLPLGWWLGLSLTCAVCGLLSLNYFLRHPPLYWNARRAAGEVTRFLVEKDAALVFSRHGPFSPLPSLQAHQPELMQALRPGEEFYFVNYEIPLSGNGRILTPWCSLERKGMETLFGTTIESDLSVDGLWYGTSLFRDALREQKQKYAIEVLRGNILLVSRSATAVQSFRSADWKPNSQPSVSDLATCDQFTQYQGTYLVASKPEARMTTVDLSKLFSAEKGFLALEVYSYDIPNQEVQLQIAWGEKTRTLTYSSSKAGRYVIPLGPWSSTEVPHFTIETVRVEQRCAYILRLHFLVSPPKSPAQEAFRYQFDGAELEAPAR